MRRSVAALILVTASGALPAAPPELQLDVGGSGPIEEHMLERDFAPGQSSGWHIHHGVELTYLLSGEMQLSIAGQAPRVVHAGEFMAIPRDVPHEAHAIGAETARLIVTYAIDKGSPTRIPVPAPASAGQ